MTEPAYHRDAYLRELETEVIEVGEEDGRPFAVLSDTLFYPEGGGQPADHGRLGPADVVDVQKCDHAIRHYLSQSTAIGPVHLELDWARRWDHMQQHTGQHVLTAVALRENGWRTTAFHLGSDTSDIELDVPDLGRSELDHLEEAVAAEIRADRAVTARTAEVADFERLGVRSRLLPKGFEGPVRLIEIDTLDLNTCGGTHCRSTAEIGQLCLLSTEPMRGGTRVRFVAGDRVRRRMAAHEERSLQLRSLLDTGDNELPEVVALRLEREKELARSIRRLEEELADLVAASLADDERDVVEAHWKERDMTFLQRVGRILAASAPSKLALLTAEGGGEAYFVVVVGGASGRRSDDLGPRVADALGGRGGGRGEIYQGKATSLEGREHAFRVLREA